MLEGLLVDLVPQHQGVRARDQRWRNSEARYWTSGGEREFFSQAHSERQLQQYAEAWQPNAPRIFFGIQTKDGVPLGFMGLPEISFQHRTGMLGTRIGEPEYWGGGYGTDALLLIVDYAFDWLDLRRLWLKTMSSNVRVHRQMTKVGFVREGEEREATYADGEPVGWTVYGLLREEWPGRLAMIERLGLRAK
ncbi:MAG: GNAT family N-acetyltransferase [Anaerolineae bacterium]|nr:GNAT family N-acetyltransferase [Anaerolineae bacterium]